MSFQRTCDTRPPSRPATPPSNPDPARRNPTPNHNSSFHCQPSEETDYTVTDLLPNPVISYSGVFHPQLDRVRQNTALSYSKNVVFPVMYGDAFPELVAASSVANNAGSSELNLRSDLSQPNPTEGQSEANLEATSNVPSRKEQRLHEKSRSASRPMVGGRTSMRDFVDCPGYGARPSEEEPEEAEVAMLRRNYSRLLENHQRFIISHAQLHTIKEELLGRVASQEIELDLARYMIESLESDKQQLKDELESVQKMLNIVRDQMPLLATEAGQPWQQTTNDKGNDEWTSSLKEELRQTILLAMQQQQQLHDLYAIIKQQNKAIRQLTTTSDPEARPRPLLLQGHARKELEFRQNPEGSSVSAQEKVKEQRAFYGGPPRTESKSGNITIPLKNPFRKIFGKRTGTSPPDDVPKPNTATAATVEISSSPLATVAKQRSPTVAKQYMPSVRPVKTSRDCELVALKGPPALYPAANRGELDYGAGISDVDLENSSFVFVDPSVAETRICPLCSAEFSSEGTTMEQFVEHVSQCVPPAQHRLCPVCLQKFEKSVSDREIELHVNDHFDDDRFQCLSPIGNK